MEVIFPMPTKTLSTAPVTGSTFPISQPHVYPSVGSFLPFLVAGVSGLNRAATCAQVLAASGAVAVRRGASRFQPVPQRPHHRHPQPDAQDGDAESAPEGAQPAQAERGEGRA